MSQAEARPYQVHIVTEGVCQKVMTRADAFAAVSDVFAAMAAGDAVNFPVVREALGHADALYGFKSGFDRAGMALGLKSGGYWPKNFERGLTNHQSTVFLFDPDTGRLKALVGGNYLTAIRTAAASAVSIAQLARTDAKTLGIVGAGHQAAFQLQAALDQRDFTTVLAANRTPGKTEKLKAVAEERGKAFEEVSAQELAARADVIITIVSAHAPQLLRDWVKPGTHIAAMGTDTKGKMELDPELVAAAHLFTDERAQSTSIGEFQHAVNQGLVIHDAITPLGAVINATAAGRQEEDEITIFDGTGVGLQDLAAASVVLKRAVEMDLVQTIGL